MKRLLTEDPDTVYVNDEQGQQVEYDHRDNSVIGIFSVIEIDQRTVTVAVKKSTRDILIDDSEIEKSYKAYNTDDLKFHKTHFYHHWLHEPLTDAGLVGGSDRDGEEYLVSGRIWLDVDVKESGYTVCSFWQTHNTVKNYLVGVTNAFVMLGLDIKKCRFEFLNKPEELFSYNDAFVSGDIGKTKELSSQQIKQLQKIQHLSPIAKQALLTNYPANRLQLAADKLGVSYAQLRHILTGPEMIGKKSFEENLDINSFLDDDNLNFSDYFSPTIPYDVKPVPSLKPME